MSKEGEKPEFDSSSLEHTSITLLTKYYLISECETTCFSLNNPFLLCGKFLLVCYLYSTITDLMENKSTQY